MRPIFIRPPIGWVEAIGHAGDFAMHELDYLRRVYHAKAEKFVGLGI
jgi:hypothetical protein